MNNLVCPVCGSSNIQTERRPDGFHHCMECRYSWAIGASQQKPTVFEHITQSREVLAEKLVFLKAVIQSFNAKDNTHYIEQWISTICNDVYPSKHEALEATTEELKKEWKG